MINPRSISRVSIRDSLFRATRCPPTSFRQQSLGNRRCAKHMAFARRKSASQDDDEPLIDISAEEVDEFETEDDILGETHALSFIT